MKNNMLWNEIINKVEQLQLKYSTRRQLAKLSDRQLKDIAISREQAAAEANKARINSIIKALFIELKNTKK